MRAIVLGALPLLAGCLPRVHLPYEPAPWRVAERAGAVPAALGAPRPREPPAVALTPRGGTTDYTVWRFAMDGSRGRFTGRYYRHRLGGRRALVLVLPIWGRSAYPSAITARRLTRYGEANVLVLDGTEPLFDWEAIAEAPDAEALRAAAEEAAAGFAGAVTDVRSVVDWARSREEIDPRRLGVVGFSMSAIVAATAMGVEPRIGRGAFVMGGGDLARIFATCPKRPGRIRERFLARAGWSAERFRRELEPILAPVDPLRYAGAVDPAGVLFIDAGADRCMPPASREALWEALGRPERLTIQSGHRRSFLAMTFLDNFHATKRIARFFREWEGPQRPPARVAAAGSS